MNIRTVSASWLVSALCLCLNSTVSADSAIPEIDSIFADYNESTPGCALGVMQNGEFVYRRGYGMANLEHNIPLSSSSVLRIASTSKQFTATAIALLAAQGKIRLDDPIGTYFPEFPPWAQDITVMHLVNHSSGIRDYLQLTWLQGKVDDADYYDDDYILEILTRQKETNFPAGSDYLYSNSGYVLMAYLVERVTGESLKDYAQKHIFGPLGMDNTHFHNDWRHIIPHRADGYDPTEDGFQINMNLLEMIGDGGVFITIDDFLHWERNFTNNRLGGGAAFIEQLTTPDQFTDGSAMDYAFGLSVETYRGLNVIHHGGSWVGFRAMYMRFPTEGLAVTVLCNRSDGNAVDKAYAVADHLLADKLQPRKAGEDAASDFALEEAALAEFVGDFWNRAEGFAAEAALDEGQLWAVHSPERRNPLKPIAPDRFIMLDVPAHVIVEYQRVDGRVTGLKRWINGNPRGDFEVFQRRQMNVEQLAAYSGSYYSDELSTEYRLYVENGALMLNLDGPEPMELTPMFDETFENPDWGAFEFERDASGAVTGFRLQSGRVRNLAFEKR